MLLHPHQVEATSRLRAAIDEFGGALLCDPVGTGKTFVALALARRYSQVLVVGPAVLRPMWESVAGSVGVPVQFMSHEALSRNAESSVLCDFVIVDEAHHARNVGTRRFGALSRIASGKDVVLLTATPIHNRKRDAIALLSIFLGHRAFALSNAELGRCVVRRDRPLARDGLDMPSILPLQWKQVSSSTSFGDAIMALPPPLPPRQGGDAGVLIAHSLVRQWASSDAALRGGLIRRRQRATALIAALEAGAYPSASELEAWTVSDDSVQLAFAELMASPAGNSQELLSTIRAHRDGVIELLQRLENDASRDDERATIIAGICEQHSGVPVVAFTQYEDTVDAMFGRLAKRGGVAALSGRGGRIAGGRISRGEAIARFSPRANGRSSPSIANAVSLLITTDLLSEGVNLQDAGVVIHLDLPWTPARMEQRLGRIARIGSLHDCVVSYALHPPATAEAIARLEATLERKMRSASILVGDFVSLTGIEQRRINRNEPALVESLRERLVVWRRHDAHRVSRHTLVAAVTAPTTGFLAACSHGQIVALFGSLGDEITDDPKTVLACSAIAENAQTDVDGDAVAAVAAALLSHLGARTALGVNAAPDRGESRARRALLRRIAVAVRRTRPHDRMRILPLAERARRAAAGDRGAHLERKAGAIAARELPDAEWLESVITSLEGPRCQSGDRTDTWQIVDLILFKGADHANALSRARER